ncbi:MAG: YsnF/AvaK domain-containing protein [Gammaproteobacteria bacterium]
MSHTLVAVFDNRSDAQKALEDLVASGFSRTSARLSEDDSSTLSSSPSTATPASTISSGVTTEDNATTDTGIGSSIRNFFADVFGSDREDHVNLYSNAVNRGHFVLTLTTDTEPEVERAADIVERYGPVDIDEHSQSWGASGGAYTGDSLRSSGSLNQSQSVAQQSVQSGSLQGSQTGSQQRAETALRDTNIQGTQGTQAIPVIQEELAVGKREVQRGGVRIFSRLVETPVNETIGLREEHVNVERHAVNRPVDPSDLAAFKEGTIELRETAEEAVVQKTARVVEEVVVGKQVSERQEQISDTVRHTEVQVEQLSPEEDTYYRSHWTSNYASAGGRYEDYAPAYQYGSTARNSDSYRGRNWDDVEPTLRSDWEQRNPGSAWENFKAAVRHGWDRLTS